jgi:tRNA threonylcarbamoyladenosine biosynthesis protein TsaE
MKKLSFYSYSRKQTIDFAKYLSRFIGNSQIIGLCGELGSGKTTFIKGLAKGLGFGGRVNSPSFVILKVYSIRKKSFLYHFDLYRLNSLKELEDIGYEDFVSNCGICVIEWADKAKKLLPKHYLKIQMRIKGENTRLIDLIGYGPEYERTVSRIKTHRKERG